MTLLPRKKYIVLLIMILGIGVLAPNYVGAIDNPLTSLGQDILIYMLYFAFRIAGAFIGFLTVILGWVVKLPVYPATGNLPIIASSWKIFRDMANMFFIVGLIMTAFAVIFDVGSSLKSWAGYGDWKSMLIRIIIAAVLINFSLVIGVVVIHLSQSLTNVFLNAIGDFAGRLGNIFELSKFIGVKFDDLSAMAVQNVVADSMINLVVAIIFIFAFIVATATAVGVAIIRIPVLWMLLIISPVVWIAYVFPQFKDRLGWWWKTFLGWNLFLPYFLFFLYFALLIVSQTNQNMAVLTGDFATKPPADWAESLSLNLQTLVTYIVVVIALLGGTKLALNASFFSGSGVTNVAGKISRGAKATLWRTPGLRSVEAIRKAGLEWGKQVQKEGLSGRWSGLYGGEAAEKLRQSKWEKRFRVRGAELKVQKDFVDRADKDFENVQQQYKFGKIDATTIATQARAMNASTTKGFAYRKMAAELGVLDASMFESTLTQISANPYAAEVFVQSAKKSKFSNMKPDELIRVATNPRLASNTNLMPARREIFKYIQSDKKAAAKLDSAGVDQAITAFGGPETAEAKEFIKNIEAIRPDLVAMYKSTVPGGRHILREMFNLVKEKSAGDIASMSKETWQDPIFQRALAHRIQALNRSIPALPEGTFFPRTAFPAPPPGAMTIPGGYLLPRGTPIPLGIPGGRRFKGKPAGGDAFRASLERATVGDTIKYPIAANL